MGEAIAICSDLWDRDRLDLRAARSLAVGLERSGRLPDALAVCAGALEVCGGTAPWRLALLRGAPPEGWEEEWTRRQRRLARRIRGLRSMPLGSTAQRPPALVPEGAGAVVCPPLLAY